MGDNQNITNYIANFFLRVQPLYDCSIVDVLENFPSIHSELSVVTISHHLEARPTMTMIMIIMMMTDNDDNDDYDDG